MPYLDGYDASFWHISQVNKPQEDTFWHEVLIKVNIISRNITGYKDFYVLYPHKLLEQEARSFPQKYF